MSRVARVPVELPQGVTFRQEGDSVIVKGPKAELTAHLPIRKVKLQSEGNLLTIAPIKAQPESKAAAGLIRATLANLVKGVTEEFVKELEFKGVGYRAAVEGSALKLNVGFSHPVTLEIPKGLTVEVKKNIIRVSGADAREVGQFAANVRATRPPEPYKGKGIKYADEQIRRKAGKAGKAAEGGGAA